MRREIESVFLQMLNSKDHSVIIIEGARQVGKTYFINQVLSEASRPVAAFDLEKEQKLRKQINRTEDFSDFKDLMTDQYGVNPGSILFLDEAQESKRLASYVKSFKEDWPEVQVILSGSSMNRFFSKNSRIPVGRYRSLRIFGFSFSEFVQYVQGESLADFIRSAPETVSSSRHELLLSRFDDYLRVGGYPEAVKTFASQGNPAEMIEDILFSLEEDFERKEAYQPMLFRDALSGIANHLGSPSKFTHFNTTKYYAKQILSSLKKWHIALEVESQSLVSGKGGTFLPKRYLHDCGVVQQKRSVAAPPISLLHTLDPLLRTPLGGLIENALLIQLLSGKPAPTEIGTWKKGAGDEREVDFILKLTGLGISLPIECKASLQVKRKHYKNLMHYLELTGQKIGILVTAAPLQYIKVNEKTIINVPVYLANRKNIETYAERSLSLMKRQ